MTTPVKLIATDLDGTLLRSDRTVSDRTRSAIARAQEAGIVIAVATARHPLTASGFAAQAGITGLAICVNGALIYDLGQESIRRETHFSRTTAEELIVRLRAALPGICFAIVRAMEFACEPGYAAIAEMEEHGRRLDEMPQGDALSLLDVPMTKLIARHPEIAPPAVLASLTSFGMNGYEAALSGAPFVDIVAPGVSKAAALEWIAAELGIARDEVVAFGDAPNDLEMLRWAGKAIAVANAYPEVKAEVAEITASNNDDGVAIAIERMLM